MEVIMKKILCMIVTSLAMLNGSERADIADNTIVYDPHFLSHDYSLPILESYDVDRYQPEELTFNEEEAGPAPEEDNEHDKLKEAWQEELKTTTAWTESATCQLDDNTWECPRCHKKSNSRVILAKHIAIHHTHEKIFKCQEPGCSKVFSRLFTFDKHKKLSHESYRCTYPYCEEVCISQKLLKKHQRSHIEDVCTYPCKEDGCQKTFSSLRALKGHIKKHRIKYYCKLEGCAGKFTTKRELNNHEKTHGRIFHCLIEDCFSKFMTQAALKQHEKKHNREHRWRCEYPLCDATFAFKKDLFKHHIENHIEKYIEKSLTCRTCNKAFKNRMQLKRHKKTHEDYSLLPSTHAAAQEQQSASTIQPDQEGRKRICIASLLNPQQEETTEDV